MLRSMTRVAGCRHFLIVIQLFTCSYSLRTINVPDDLITNYPPTWNVNSAVEFNRLLEWPEVKMSLSPIMVAHRLTTSWSDWSQCPPCLMMGIANTIQLRVKLQPQSENRLGSQAKLCVPNPPPCPAFRHIGCWSVVPSITRTTGSTYIYTPVTLSHCAYHHQTGSEVVFTIADGKCVVGNAREMLSGGMLSYDWCSSDRSAYDKPSGLIDLFIVSETFPPRWSFKSVKSSCDPACGFNRVTIEDTYNLTFVGARTSLQNPSIRKETRDLTCGSAVCPWGSIPYLMVVPYDMMPLLFTRIQEDCELPDMAFPDLQEIEWQEHGVDPPDLDSFVSRCAMETYHKSGCHAYVISEAKCYAASAHNDSCSKLIQMRQAGLFDCYPFALSNGTADLRVLDAEATPCSAACGGGVQHRQSRACTPAPNEECSKPYQHSQAIECNTQPCYSRELTHIGCYSVWSAVVIQDTLSILGLNNTTDFVMSCSIMAHALGVRVFAVIDGGLCAVDDNLECDYDIFGSSADCVNGTGGTNAMDIYSLTPDLSNVTSHCQVIDRDHPEQGNNLIEESVQLLDLVEQEVKARKSIGDHSIWVLRQTMESVVQNILASNGTSNVKDFIQKSTNIVEELTDDENSLYWNDPDKFPTLLKPIEDFAVILQHTTNRTAAVRSIGANIDILDPEYVETDHGFDFNLGMPGTSGSSLYIPKVTFQQGADPNTSLNLSAPDALVIVNIRNQFRTVRDTTLDKGLTVNARTTYKLSSDIITIKVKSIPDGQNLTDPINITLALTSLRHRVSEISVISPQYLCVFWNESKQVWSSQGCSTALLTPDLVSCTCNHLTSFSVLMRYNLFRPDPDADMVLDVISHTGGVISIICLLFTIITFLLLDNWKSERKAIHVNLSLALGASQILHLVGMELTKSRVTCRCIALTLHYLYTATFCWMLCEGIHLYHKIVAIFKTEDHRKKIIYYVIGWGVPAVIVVVSAASSWDGYGTRNFCWLSVDDGLVWAFVGPVCFVGAVNLVILIRVVKIVVKSTTRVVCSTQRRQLNTVKAGAKSVLILMPILGVAWLLGLLAPHRHLLVIEYLFVILNSCQGLLIFLFHCVGNSEVSAAARQKFKLFIASNKYLRRRHDNWLMRRQSASMTAAAGRTSLSLSMSGSKTTDSTTSFYSRKRNSNNINFGEMFTEDLHGLPAATDDDDDDCTDKVLTKLLEVKKDDSYDSGLPKFLYDLAADWRQSLDVLTNNDDRTVAGTDSGAYILGRWHQTSSCNSLGGSSVTPGANEPAAVVAIESADGEDKDGCTLSSLGSSD